MLKKSFLSLLAICIFSISSYAQDTLRVMTYNLLNYGNYTDYCPESMNDRDTKAANLSQILDYIQPDIFLATEMGPNSFNFSHIEANALNINGITKYAVAPISNQSGSYLCNALIYDKNIFELIEMPVINTEVRDINVYKLRYKNAWPDMFIHVIGVHFKAGSGSSEQATREIMAENVMNYLATLPSHDRFMIMGDFNVYKSSEDAFQELLNPSNSATAFNDPINRLGNWNNNSSFKDVHTQSTHSSYNGCYASGGMDDRFDFILVSNDLMNTSNSVHYIPNSYTAFGQDGLRFNGSINSPTNTVIPQSMATLLYNTSDHLPVYLDLKLEALAIGLDEEKDNAPQITYQNPTIDNLVITIASEEYQEVEFEIFTMDGKVVDQHEFKVINNASIIYPMPQKAGVYLVKITAPDWSKTIKVVKL